MPENDSLFDIVLTVLILGAFIALPLLILAILVVTGIIPLSKEAVVTAAVLQALWIYNIIRSLNR